MRMNRFGVALCAAYLLVILACLGLAAGVEGDSKGRFVFLQLPIALQGSIACTMGLGPVLRDLSWVGAYLLMAGSTFMLLYGVGWLVTPMRSSK